MRAMPTALLYALVTHSIQFSCSVLFALKASATVASLKSPDGSTSCMPIMNTDGAEMVTKSVRPRGSYVVPTRCQGKRGVPL